MDIESDVEDRRIDCLLLVNGEIESFVMYVNENDSNQQILELAHEVALMKFGSYDELKFEES